MPPLPREALLTLACLWTGGATAQPLLVQEVAARCLEPEASAPGGSGAAGWVFRRDRCREQPPPDELARLREENQRLRAELERQRVSPGPPGLIHWRTEHLMEVTGVASRDIRLDLRLARGPGVTAVGAAPFRTALSSPLASGGPLVFLVLVLLGLLLSSRVGSISSHEVAPLPGCQKLTQARRPPWRPPPRPSSPRRPGRKTPT